MNAPALRQDQLQDLSVLLVKKRHLHRGHPGTGKTPTICVLQAIRYHEHGQASVWPMPKRLMRKNLDEAMLWGGWEEGEVALVEGCETDVLAILNDEKVQVFIINFDNFRRYKDHLPERVKSIDIDEFHKGFGGHESARTQALYEFVDDKVGDEGWFVPMTGTLYNGSPDTCYPAIQVIAPTYYGTFEAFKNVHHLVDPFTGKRLGYHGLEVIEEILAEMSIVRTWEQVHGKEEIVCHVIPVEMSPRQRAAYDEFKDEGLLELENFFVDGTQPGVSYVRARQIMGHPNTFPNLAEGSKSSSTVDICPGETPGKIELFELDCEKHRDRGTPFAAFASFVPEQRQLLETARRLGLKAGLINGGTSPKEAHRIDQGFIAGDIQCLIGSPIVADCGYNWQTSGDQEVEEVIFASLPYQDTAIDQAMKRFMRRKRLTALRAKVYSYTDSLDYAVMKLTKRKSVEASKVEPGRKPLPFPDY